MHFEILVEDISGKEMLDILVPKIINPNSTYTIHSYKGIGTIPKNLKPKTNASKRILLDQLPKLLNGYGKSFQNFEGVVIIVPDLDTKNFNIFLSELKSILNSCNPKPIAEFCIAIEEGEAWLLGDLNAIKKVYSSAKLPILNSYVNDSICGTWELLADSIYNGGHEKLKKLGFQEVGKMKSEWAKKISPEIDIEHNSSPSFCFFRDTLRTLEN